MTKEDALLSFYNHNAIECSDINNDGFLNTISDRIDTWLENIDRCDHDLFLRMVSKYNYITYTTAIHRYANAVSRLKKHLEHQGLLLSDVLFITTKQRETKRGNDNVKTDLHALTILDIDAQQIISANVRDIEDSLLPIQAVVFVDDIISTGYILRSTIEDFVSRTDSLGLLDNFLAKELFFICIVPTKTGLKHIKKKCQDIGLRITPIYDEEWNTKSAFKGNYIFSDKEKSEVMAKIEKYEELINNEIAKDGESYVFGFEQRKQLVSFYYNTPNNTLCSFWGHTSQHIPLFKRQNQPIPSMIELRKVKKRKTNAVYYLGREKLERIRSAESEELKTKIIEIYRNLDIVKSLDYLDSQLLGYLSQNSSASYPQIAQALECTKENVDERIQKLFNSGYIKISEKHAYIVTKDAMDAISYSYKFKDIDYNRNNFDITGLYIPQEPLTN